MSLLASFIKGGGEFARHNLARTFEVPFGPIGGHSQTRPRCFGGGVGGGFHGTRLKTQQAQTSKHEDKNNKNPHNKEKQRLKKGGRTKKQHERLPLNLRQPQKNTGWASCTTPRPPPPARQSAKAPRGVAQSSDQAKVALCFGTAP